jgi:hypothetical protein
MKTASAKAKGRRAAVEVKKTLRTTFPSLEEDDILVTSSGVNGEDLVLSPKARKLIPLCFEVKNQEKLNIWKAIEQSKTHVKHAGLVPVVVFKRNNTPLHVVLKWEDFLSIFKEGK